MTGTSMRTPTTVARAAPEFSPNRLMAARWLLERNPNPTDAEIREGLSGQLCRCTGYDNIIKAVRWAAEHRAEDQQGANA